MQCTSILFARSYPGDLPDTCFDDAGVTAEITTLALLADSGKNFLCVCEISRYNL
jgi:hypothetical protein